EGSGHTVEGELVADVLDLGRIVPRLQLAPAGAELADEPGGTVVGGGPRRIRDGGRPAGATGLVPGQPAEAEAQEGHGEVAYERAVNALQGAFRGARPAVAIPEVEVAGALGAGELAGAEEVDVRGGPAVGLIEGAAGLVERVEGRTILAVHGK